ncbi:MAG TPA: hypothetical protein VLA33_09745 [Gemmatimonadota bacterium]|nr:hypothetical protein [Gemmatimonadota bacterium]
MDFGWIVLLVVVWVLSAIGEMRKKQGGKPRPRPRSRAKPKPDEHDVALGPVAGRRDLARDIAEGARRAEDALRGWEARQAAETWRPPEAPAEVHTEPAASVRRPVHRASQIHGPSLLTKGGTLQTARRPVAALREPPVRTTDTGLARIERLAPLQRAVVWSELLGPPVGLREDT